MAIWFIFFANHLNLPNAIVRQESRKSKQSVSGGARSWRRVWSSLLSLSFTGNLIPALFLLDWAIHAMLEADVRAWKGLFLQYTIAMCTYVYISEMWKYLELVSHSRITFRALSKVLSSHKLFYLTIPNRLEKQQWRLTKQYYKTPNQYWLNYTLRFVSALVSGNIMSTRIPRRMIFVIFT